MTCTKLITNQGYIGIARQTVKGIAESVSDYFIKYEEEGFATEFETQPLREGGDDEYIGDALKNLHTEKFTITALARPQLIAYLWAWVLGKDVNSGASDPYTHILTRIPCGRQWFTIRRKLTTGYVQVLQDCKIEKITLEMEAGKALKVVIEGNALTASSTASEETPVYEVADPFMFFHGEGRYKINSAVTRDIKKISLGYTVASQEGLQTDEILLADLPDLKVDVDFSCEVYAASITDFFKKVNYNNSTAPQEDLFSFPFEVDLRQTVTSPDDRQLKVEIGKIIATPITGINLKGEPEAMVQTLAGVATVPDTGEHFKVTLKNDLSQNLISES